ncbi:hypothetical protein OAQ81_01895 [Candidatus Thioglobus sp.]|nr:hypothetical protein [Candidatus Thioglobus sp.]
MIEPFKTIDKGLDSILEYLGDLTDKITYVVPLAYQSMKTLYSVDKDITKGLTTETTLTKKQAKKISGDSMLSIVDAFDADEDQIEAYSFLATNLIMIYSIRDNKNYADNIHQYCDNDLKLIDEAVNKSEYREEMYTIAEHKRLNVLIDKYMNSFDKFKEFKKYNGIWH